MLILIKIFGASVAVKKQETLKNLLKKQMDSKKISSDYGIFRNKYQEEKLKQESNQFPHTNPTAIHEIGSLHWSAHVLMVFF